MMKTTDSQTVDAFAWWPNNPIAISVLKQDNTEKSRIMYTRNNSSFSIDLVQHFSDTLD